jgi:hypothetical protein
MSRRFNAERAVTAAENAERKAWEAFRASPDRTRSDVASNPVKGDSFTIDLGPGLGSRFATYVMVSPVAPLADRVAVSRNGGATVFPTSDVWAGLVRAAESVDPVYPPARMARRGSWERAAARLENARRKLDALPPAGHKRRKDGSVYAVQGPRENAAAKAGRDAWRRAAGRSLAFMGVALAFVVLFLSACN